MSRAKRKRLIAETISQMRAYPEAPITLKTLAVHWDTRTVVFNGRTIQCGPEDSVIFPVLDTTKLVVLPHGGEVL